MATKIINASIDEIEAAKETAVSLISDSNITTAIELFYSENLDEIESGIKRLNDFSNKSWLLSSILLYTLIYNRDLYRQSGLSWSEYSKQARERLGLDPRDITEQLSAARFFIMNHNALERAGFNPIGSNRKLSYAELATELCGDVNMTITHIVNDTWKDFKDWYSQYKQKKALPQELKRPDVQINGDKFIINGIEAVKIDDSIPSNDKARLTEYIKQIFEAIQQGYEPAIVPVYDKKEAMLLPRLRDKYRQGK